MSVTLRWTALVPASWEVHPLKRLAAITNSNVDKKAYEGDSAVRLCNYVDVYYNEHITDDLPLMEATATEAEKAKFTLRAGDVIITKDSESWDDIAVPAHVPRDLPGVVCGYHLTLLRPNDAIEGSFLLRCLQATGIREQLWVAANGVTRFGLTQRGIKEALFPVPPRSTQRAIAGFLDRKTAAIDGLIAKKERLIELLQEKRQALITRAVTKGLDPNVPMKDSGIEWLGEIPSHWEVLRARALLFEPGTRSTTGEEELLTVSHITGVSPRSQNRQVTMTMAESLVDYKVCEPGDLVVNTMWAWMGAMGVAFERGIVSPSYNVYRWRASRGSVVSRYYDFLIRTPPYVAEVTRWSKGIWTSRLRLYPTEFLSISLPVPPAAEQQQIVDAVDELLEQDAVLSAKLNQAIDRLREYRQALITAAVTGQLEVAENIAEEAVA